MLTSKDTMLIELSVCLLSLQSCSQNIDPAVQFKLTVKLVLMLVIVYSFVVEYIYHKLTAYHVQTLLKEDYTQCSTVKISVANGLCLHSVPNRNLFQCNHHFK